MEVGPLEANELSHHISVGWDYDAWAWYDVGHDADRRERRDRGNLYLYIYSALLSWKDPYGLSPH